MGQKVHPNGIRLGITKDHTSIWYAERGDYANISLIGNMSNYTYILFFSYSGIMSWIHSK